MIVDLDAESGEIIWAREPVAGGTSNVERFAAFARERGEPVGDDYAALWRWSTTHSDRFWSLWADFAGVDLAGARACTDDPMPHTRWFPGSTVNFAQHVLEGREGTAIIAVTEDGAREDIRWEDLRKQVSSFAAHLRASGVEPGDRVVGVLPNVPEAVIALLATASIGAVWSVCSPEFGVGAISARFAQLNPKVVIAVPGFRLGGRDRDRTADIVQLLQALPDVSQVVWVTRHVAVAPAQTSARAVQWEDALATPAPAHYEAVDFSHPLWVLFSSGTTGIPKGIVHGHGGALLELSKLVSVHGDMGPGDRYFSVASTSWVVWNAMVGGMAVGATAVLLDGNPTHPSVDHVWRVAADVQATVVGVSAGFVHACQAEEIVPSRGRDLSRLRCVQVTGSILADEAYRWFYRNVGDVWLASMSGGTDVASIFVGGVPTEPVRVGRIQVPALGVAVSSWDDSGTPTSGRGELVVTGAMPSMPLRFWADADGSRYHASYFTMYPGVWRHGDHIQMDESGVRILGRSDATLNRNGLRLGPADIYAAVERLPEVIEAMVVGIEIGTDYYMPLFLQLVPGADEAAARDAVVGSIRSCLSPRYVPDDIFVVRGIPHTRTGKKLEVPVKRLFQGDALDAVADPGAVDDAELLGEYAHLAQRRMSRRT